MKKLYIFGILWLIGICSFPVMAAEPVKIAAIIAKTGISAEENAPYVLMIELAVEELNSQGGLLGRPVELIIIDNKSTPIGATLAAKEALQLQVTAVIGASWSSQALAMAPILQQEGIPMITPLATNPKITRVGNCIFRVCFTDSIQGKAMARFAYTELGAQTVIVLKILNEIYSLTLAKSFVNSFQQYGGKVLFEGGYTRKAVNFKDILKKAQNLNPDVVFVPGFSRDSGLLIKQAVSMGIRTTFLGGDGFVQIHDYGGNAVEGSYYSTFWHPDVPSKKKNHLQNIYKQKYKKESTTIDAPLVYDAVMVLADAIRRADSLDRAKIREALAETKEFEGVTGPITFDEQGDPLNKPVVIIKLEKKDQVYFKSIKP
ncbi:ABC transporter substrate-binding protein [Desulfobacula sp.]|uniref:ABC transporter substrate-binding protein n=1 Tax=Desulfobacula sp. TaxID=2593537 RepID=UPI0025C66D5D|nr:ABC transporter substrate-binding protein [Desulfobacula sp.]MBC2704078.1 ABC transporter substrate-binding protein [Desulfobacula sp.]